MPETPTPDPTGRRGLRSTGEITEELLLLLRFGNLSQFVHHLIQRHDLSRANTPLYDVVEFYESTAACKDSCTWVDIVFPPDGYKTDQARSPVRKWAGFGSSAEQTAAELGLCTAKQIAEMFGVAAEEAPGFVLKLKKHGLDPKEVSVMVPNNAKLYSAEDAFKANAKREESKLRPPAEPPERTKLGQQLVDAVEQFASEKGLVTAAQAAADLGVKRKNPATLMHRLKEHGLQVMAEFNQRHLYRLADVKAAANALKASRDARNTRAKSHEEPPR